MDWSLLPKDNPVQSVRIRRMLMASVASAMVVALTWVGAWLNFVPYSTFWRFAAIVSMLVVGFYVCFRSGLNLRLSDPSLTIPMIVAAGLTISVVQVDAGQAREDLMLLYPVAYMFGVFRLTQRELVAMALLFPAFFAVATGVSVWSDRMTADINHEIFRVGFLTVVLVWFAYVGGNISALRRRLRLANGELKVAFDRVEALANHDTLTGAYSRRHVMTLLGLEAKRAERGSVLSICMVDIDHFKSINDSYGHGAGDEALKCFSATVQSALRALDLLGRYGGEEFIVGLSQAPGAQAVRVAERIREMVAQSTIPCLPAEKRITVSIGVAEHRAPDHIEQTIARADAALYQAKSAGRNRVVLAD
jgi:diguanylate cyclase (GGDEF)-like protein